MRDNIKIQIESLQLTASRLGALGLRASELSSAMEAFSQANDLMRFKLEVLESSTVYDPFPFPEAPAEKGTPLKAVGEGRFTDSYGREYFRHKRGGLRRVKPKHKTRGACSST